MAEVKLAGGNGRDLVALLDDCDLALVQRFRWFAHRPSASLTIYAKSPSIYMHRLILNAPKGLVVDHIDGNGLNNRRSNLRLVTHADNLRLGNERRLIERARRLFDENEHLL